MLVQQEEMVGMDCTVMQLLGAVADSEIQLMVMEDVVVEVVQGIHLELKLNLVRIEMVAH